EVGDVERTRDGLLVVDTGIARRQHGIGQRRGTGLAGRESQEPHENQESDPRLHCSPPCLLDGNAQRILGWILSNAAQESPKNRKRSADTTATGVCARSSQAPS